MSKTMVMDYDCQKKPFIEIDDNFAKGVVAIAYPGKNRNRSNISKAAFEKALPSLKNKPIVGRFIPEDNDFGAHDVDLAVDPATNETDIINVTVPFGVVPESAQQYWDTVIEEDGTEREYLFTEALFWKRQFGYKTIAQKQRLHQSMEINVFDYTIEDDGYCNIENFEWSALCILGDNVEPCFESASVQLFATQNNTTFAKQFSQMLEDLAELSKTINFTEGGNDTKMDDITNVSEAITEAVENAETFEEVSDTVETPEAVEDESATIEADASVEEETVTTEETPADAEEFVTEGDAVSDSAVINNADEVSVTETVTESTDATFVKKFELPHDEVRHKIYEALLPFEEATGDWYLIESVYDQYFVVHVSTYAGGSYHTKYLKWEYTKNDTDVTLMGTPVEVMCEWITTEEHDALTQMRANYESVLAENIALMAYKAEIEAAQLDSEKEELYAQWAPLIGAESEAYQNLYAKKETYNVEQLAMALKIAYADVHAKFACKPKAIENTSLVRVPVANEQADLPYGGLFEKHGFTPHN